MRYTTTRYTGGVGTGATVAAVAAETAVYTAGRYYRFPNTTLSTGLVVSGRLYATPVFIPATITLDRIGAEVTTAGTTDATVRLGIYADDGTFRPGARVLDAGTIDGLSATAQEITISQQLTRGRYWFVSVGQGTATMATMRTMNHAGYMNSYPLDYGTTIPTTGTVVFGYRDDGISAALPATFTVDALSSTTFHPAIFGRVA